MSGKPAARLGDPTMHGPPLVPGPPAVTVIIGGQPAWKGLPAGAGAALQAAQKASEQALQIAEQTAQVAEKAAIAAAGTPGAPAAAAAATAARTAAELAKTTAAGVMGGMISGLAAGGSSIHMCPVVWPIPPHGPGVIIDGSTTVLIENMTATRQGDTCIEAIGPPDKIAMGCPTVLIGDSGSGGGGGGAGAGGAAGGAGGAAAGAGAGAGAAAGAGAGAAAANGPFDTADAAAKAAMEKANPQSIKDNLEYSGLVYQGADGKYYYTGPAQGSDQGADPWTDAPVPAGGKEVAYYHTHGDYSTKDPATGAAVRTSDPARDDFNSDNFSSADKRAAANGAATTPGYAGYLGTPGGQYKKYDPATGTVSNL